MLCRKIRYAQEFDAQTTLSANIFRLAGVQHFEKWAERVPSSPASDDDATGGAAMMADAAVRHGITVTGGVVERASDGHLYNSMPVYGPSGSLLTTYRKIHLSRVLGVTSESDVFTRGAKPATARIATKDGEEAFRLGMMCCFDLRFPRLLARYGPAAGSARTDIVCAPSAFLEATGVDHWQLLCRRTALDAQAFVVAPNVAYDAADAVPLHGKSLICDPWGDIVAQTSAEGDDMAIADVSRERIEDVRRRLPLEREQKEC